MSAQSTMGCFTSSNSAENQKPDCVEQFLVSRTKIGSQDIQSEFKEGMLLIRGTVPSYYSKQLAQEYARQIPGVERVVNHLTVIRA